MAVSGKLGLAHDLLKKKWKLSYGPYRLRVQIGSLLKKIKLSNLKKRVNLQKKF
jgi:hypothetical protein